MGTLEALPETITEIENMTAMIDLYKNTWYHTNILELTAENLSDEDIDLEAYMALEEKMKEEPAEALIDAFILGIENSGEEFSDEEIDQFCRSS